MATGGGCICSLLRRHDDQLLGLSSEGRLLWWNTGRDAAQPMLYDEIPRIIQRLRIEDDSTVLVIKTDSLSESGAVLQLMETLQRPDVNMLRFSLMTMMKESREAARPAGGKEM
jgi:hypothetical protein